MMWDIDQLKPLSATVVLCLLGPCFLFPHITFKLVPIFLIPKIGQNCFCSVVL